MSDEPIIDNEPAINDEDIMTTVHDSEDSEYENVESVFS